MTSKMNSLIVFKQLSNHVSKRIRLDPYLIIYTKISFKWIRGLNIKNETYYIKMSELFSNLLVLFV